MKRFFKLFILGAAASAVMAAADTSLVVYHVTAQTCVTAAGFYSFLGVPCKQMAQITVNNAVPEAVGYAVTITYTTKSGAVASRSQYGSVNREPGGFAWTVVRWFLDDVTVTSVRAQPLTSLPDPVTVNGTF